MLCARPSLLPYCCSINGADGLQKTAGLQLCPGSSRVPTFAVLEAEAASDIMGVGMATKFHPKHQAELCQVSHREVCCIEQIGPGTLCFRSLAEEG